MKLSIRTITTFKQATEQLSMFSSRLEMTNEDWNCFTESVNLIEASYFGYIDVDETRAEFDRLSLKSKGLILKVLDKTKEEKAPFKTEKKGDKSEKISRWENLRPIDMEGKEKNKFFKGERKLLSVNFPTPRISSYEPEVGCKIAPIISLQFLEMLANHVSIDDFLDLLFPFSFLPERLHYRGRMRENAEDEFSRKFFELLNLDFDSFIPHTLKLCLSFKNFRFQSPVLKSVWFKGLLPLAKNFLQAAEVSVEEKAIVIAVLMRSGQFVITNKLLKELFQDSFMSNHKLLSTRAISQICEAMMLTGSAYPEFLELFAGDETVTETIKFFHLNNLFK